jgi:hypothetical protein
MRIKSLLSASVVLVLMFAAISPLVDALHAQPKASCKTTRNALKRVKTNIAKEKKLYQIALRRLIKFSELVDSQTKAYNQQEVVFVEQFRDLADELADKLGYATTRTGDYRFDVTFDPMRRPISTKVFLLHDPFLLTVQSTTNPLRVGTPGEAALLPADVVTLPGPPVFRSSIQNFLNQITGDPALFSGSEQERAIAQQHAKLESVNITVGKIVRKIGDAEAAALERSLKQYSNDAREVVLVGGKRGVNTIRDRHEVLVNKKAALELSLKSPICN